MFFDLFDSRLESCEYLLVQCRLRGRFAETHAMGVEIKKFFAEYKIDAESEVLVALFGLVYALTQRVLTDSLITGVRSIFRITFFGR